MSETAADRAWVLPNEAAPIRLMATIWADTAGVHDDLAAAADVDAWLDAIGLDRHGDRATDAELAAARRLRDAVRRLAAQVTADDRPAAQSATRDIGAALRDLNQAAAHLPVPQLTLDGGMPRETAASGSTAVTAALARVARESITLLGGPGAAELRACHAPGCVLYFTKTHPRREWCSIACGNRARAARHYDKVRSTR
ncbi:MAG TPA: ABATE domain-containing protein [Trebonia sp.]